MKKKCEIPNEYQLDNNSKLFSNRNSILNIKRNSRTNENNLFIS